MDELILATARRLELPPLVRQEVTIVNAGSPAYNAMAAASTTTTPSAVTLANEAALAAPATHGPSDKRSGQPTGRKSVSILLPEKGLV